MNWMVRRLLCRYAAELGNELVRGLGPDLRDKVAPAQQVLNEEPAIETFTFLAYDEGGRMTGPTGVHRLVCVADSGAKVVILGRGSELKNINAVLEASLPCIVRCETHPASRTANRHWGHTHWVREYNMLEATCLRVDEEILEPRGTSV